MLSVRPITFRAAAEYVGRLHRHNKPPRGCKFCVSVVDEGGEVRGVATVGRPVARALDDGKTCEVNRTCTDGARNANSMLYGAARRAAFAMGYERVITYTQANESGDSLHAAGFVRVKELRPRSGWAAGTADPVLKAMRDPVGNGGVARVLWESRRGGKAA